VKLNIPTAQEAAEQANAVVDERAAIYAQEAEQTILAAILRGHRSVALPDDMPPQVENALRAAGYGTRFKSCGYNEYEFEVTW